nr:ribonuclease domain-containing protein [uncultured Oscillibacter sp.]
MKRWLGGLLAALTLLSLTACGGIVDLTDVPEDGTRFEDTKVDLPAVESPEDLENASGEEDPPPENPSSGAEDPYAPEDAEPLPEEPEQPGNASSEDQSAGTDALPENGSYTTKEDVALYIHTYGRLPGNFITKKEAQNLGWPGGDLEPYAPGMCIGGSRFGNYEGLLPEAKGRTYTECDIDTLGAKSRGAKRIVFSNDGLIYYTEDHYESFELLYGDESDG